MGMRRTWPFELPAAGTLTEEALAAQVLPPVPGRYALGVGLTSRCNFDCPMCYYHDSHASASARSDMPLPLLKTILEGCPRLANIAFALEGEPFCHRDVFAALDLGMEHAGTLSVSTNASMLTRDTLRRLAGYPFALFSLSVDAADAATYARLRRGGSLAVFERNAALACETLGRSVIFNSVICRENLASVPGLPALAARCGVSVISCMQLRPHEGSRAANLSPAGTEELLACLEKMVEQAGKHRVALVFDEFFGSDAVMARLGGLLGRLGLPAPVRGPGCPILGHYTSVLSSGELFACCG
ncbi:MAG: radical SAM protein, partial [Desulfovibrionaceae bacterium]|nr:radical SAM protein [Desulfovibrionaceae bacterium]